MAEEIIRAGMEVVGGDGGRVRTADGLGGGLLRLTCRDDPGGAGEQRFPPLRLVERAEAGQVRLTVGAPDGDGSPRPGQVPAQDAGVVVSEVAGQAGGGTGRHAPLGGDPRLPRDPDTDPRAGRDPKR